MGAWVIVNVGWMQLWVPPGACSGERAVGWGWMQVRVPNGAAAVEGAWGMGDGDGCGMQVWVQPHARGMVLCRENGGAGTVCASARRAGVHATLLFRCRTAVPLCAVWRVLKGHSASGDTPHTRGHLPCSAWQLLVLYGTVSNGC